MVTQEQLDYIKSQLAAGVSKESIQIALVSQGWSKEDVMQGFAMATNPQANIPVATSTVTQSKSIIWTKSIPVFNTIFMVISVLLVFGLDLFILIQSPALVGFWVEMLIVFAIFAIFYCFENFVLRKRFANTRSSLDIWLMFIIVGRNIIFVLNFIPLIQIFGFLFLVGPLILLQSLASGFSATGLPYVLGVGLTFWSLILSYIILLAKRNKIAKSQS
jgi:hypothetical protein